MGRLGWGREKRGRSWLTDRGASRRLSCCSPPLSTRRRLPPVSTHVNGWSQRRPWQEDSRRFRARRGAGRSTQTAGARAGVEYQRGSSEERLVWELRRRRFELAGAHGRRLCLPAAAGGERGWLVRSTCAPAIVAWRRERRLEKRVRRRASKSAAAKGRCGCKDQSKATTQGRASEQSRGNKRDTRRRGGGRGIQRRCSLRWNVGRSNFGGGFTSGPASHYWQIRRRRSLMWNRGSQTTLGVVVEASHLGMCTSVLKDPREQRTNSPACML